MRRRTTLPVRPVQAFYTDIFPLPLPAGHRFPLAKYAALRARIEAQLPAVRLALAPAASPAQLCVAHDPAYVNDVLEGRLSAVAQRAVGLPWSPPMVERSLRSAGATIAACRSALADGVAANLAGGTHHAHRDRGAGYCVFNDAAVAARLLLGEGALARVAVIDCDVHQGDGTASIAAGDGRIFTLSLHGQKNYPFRKAASDLDVALPDGCRDGQYLDALDAALDALFQRFAPDLAIYLAGADPYEGDRLGRLALSKAGLAERDQRVLEACRGRGVPVALAMAGGYAEPVDHTVDIHFGTVTQALRAWERRAPSPHQPSR